MLTATSIVSLVNACALDEWVIARSKTTAKGEFWVSIPKACTRASTEARDVFLGGVLHDADELREGPCARHQVLKAHLTRSGIGTGL